MVAPAGCPLITIQQVRGMALEREFIDQGCDTDPAGMWPAKPSSLVVAPRPYEILSYLQVMRSIIWTCEKRETTASNCSAKAGACS